MCTFGGRLRRQLCLLGASGVLGSGLCLRTLRLALRLDPKPATSASGVLQVSGIMGLLAWVKPKRVKTEPS